MVGKGGRAAPRLAWQFTQKDGCAQRTVAQARPKPTSYRDKPRSWNTVLTIIVPVILIMGYVIFFMPAKTHKGAKTFMTYKLSWAQRRLILGSKKSRRHRKNFVKSTMMCFCSIQEITSQTIWFSSTLVLWGDLWSNSSLMINLYMSQVESSRKVSMQLSFFEKWTLAFALEKRQVWLIAIWIPM